MKKFLTFVFIISSLATNAANIIEDKRVKEQENCFNGIFSSYDSWRNAIKERHKTRIKSEIKLSMKMKDFDSRFGKEKFEIYRQNIECAMFEYLVDGINVSGYVVRPKKTTKKLPVLVFNRGGNGKFGRVKFHSMMKNLFPLVLDGFVIVGSQYRGSPTQNSGPDEFGGADVNDVVVLVDLIPNIDGADPERVGMYGWSRGGMQTHLAVKRLKNKVKAIATGASPTDLFKGLANRPSMEKMYKRRIPNYEKNKQAELEKRSVLLWADKLSPKIPILLLHGSNDQRVSVNHSIEFAEALVKNKIPHKLIIFPEDNHGLLKNKAEANRELINWFRQHL